MSNIQETNPADSNQNRLDEYKLMDSPQDNLSCPQEGMLRISHFTRRTIPTMLHCLRLMGNPHEREEEEMDKDRTPLAGQPL